MLELIIGLIIGRNTSTQKVNDIEDITIEEEIIIPEEKVYKYVPIPELYNQPATLESSYTDYENTDLVCIFKDGILYYYLQVEVEKSLTTWGDEKLLEYI